MQIKRHILFGCAIAAVSTSSLAFFCRPYVGAGFGSDPAVWKFEQALSVQGTEPPNMLAGQALHGTQWSAYGGCELDFNRFLLGLEVSGGTSTSEYRYARLIGDGFGLTPAANQYLFSKVNLGISMSPGFRINYQSLYGRIGAQWTRFKYSTDDTANNPDLARFEFQRYGDGLITGLGISAPIGDYFAIRNEYDHTFYHTIRQYSGTSQLNWMPSQDAYWLSLSFYLMGDTPIKDKNTDVLDPGAYAGAGVGRNIGRIKQLGTSTSIGMIEQSQGLSGILGQLFLGYDWQLWQQLHLAGELGASYSSAKFSADNKDIAESYYQESMHSYYTMKARLGVKTAPSNMLFATGGVAYANFVRTDTRSVVAGSGFMVNNFDTHKWGWVVGVGDEFMLTKNLAYRIEGDFMHFEVIHGTNTVAGTGTPMKWTPYNEQATVSLVYHM